MMKTLDTNNETDPQTVSSEAKRSNENQTSLGHLHYVLSTHWDREYYQDFQGFRYRLVDIMDRILEGIESGRLMGPFQLDGQVCPIEDYLEARPERIEQVQKYAREGKLVLGPWYTMPDTFLVSGESLIRNLEMGAKQAKRWGQETVCRSANCCDLFGFTGQLPQIFRQLGLEVAYIWRGLNHPEVRHLRWRGDDGTELLCYRFGTNSYWGYGVHVRRVNQHEGQPDADRFQHDLLHYAEHEAARTPSGPVLLFDGIDHAAWDEEKYGLLKSWLEKGVLRNGATTPKAKISHTDLEAYAEELLAVGHEVATEVQGELRSAGREHDGTDNQQLLAGVLSNRAWIKRQNAECEAQLCQVAEPLAAWRAFEVGDRELGGLLEVAWRHLLQNHFHDSICGTYVDEVDHEMRHRFRQASRIAEEVTQDTLRLIAANVSLPTSQGEEVEEEILTVYHPSAQPNRAVVTATVELPTLDTKPTELGILLRDEHGVIHPTQVLRAEKKCHRYRTFATKEPLHDKVDRLQIAFETEFEGLGYQSWQVLRGQQANALGEQDIVQGMSLENEFLKVLVQPDGTASLVDKETMECLHGVGMLESESDLGTHFHYMKPAGAVRQTTLGQQARRSCVANGPFLGCLQAQYDWVLPAGYNEESDQPEEKVVTCPVEMRYTLRKGSRELEIELSFENQARDHRVRMQVPTGKLDGQFITDAAFSTVERPMGLPQYDYQPNEPTNCGHPVQTWAGVRTAQGNGVAVLVHGCREASCEEVDKEAMLRFTILRANERYKFVDANTEAQVIGRHDYRFSVTSCGSWDSSDLFRRGQLLAAGWKSAMADQAERRRLGGRAKLSPRHALVKVSHNLVLSSCRSVTGNQLEIRVFNPANEGVEGTISAASNVIFQPVDFKGTAMAKDVTSADGQFTVSLKPREIATFIVNRAN